MTLSLRLVTFIAVIFANQLMAAEWTTYFPTNKIIKAKVMAIGSSKEIAIITQKLQQGIASHPQWFQKYVSELRSGEAMPYHTNLGVTKAEYEQFLKLKDVTLHEIGTVQVEFKSVQNGDIVIKTIPVSPIDGLLVSKNSVTTPHGITTRFTSIHNTNTKSPTGAWNGIQWSLNNLDDQDIKKTNLTEIKGKKVQLAVGKLEKTGEGILYYDLKDIDMSKNKKIMLSYIIYYPLFEGQFSQPIP